MHNGFLTIGELCHRIGVREHTLRYWEREFSNFLKPYRSKGGHRRYGKDDLKQLLRIKKLLKEKRYTIKGAKKILEGNGNIKNKEEEKSSRRGNYFQGKKILITGGTGTVGREITRKLLSLNPSVIRIYSRDETKQFSMQEELGNVKKMKKKELWKETICT